MKENIFLSSLHSIKSKEETIIIETVLQRWNKYIKELFHNNRRGKSYDT